MESVGNMAVAIAKQQVMVRIRIALIIVAVVVAFAGCSVLVVTSFFSGNSWSAPICQPHTKTDMIVANTHMRQFDYDEIQVRNAWIIWNTGVAGAVPEKGLIIGIATAMQESSLRNIGNDADSDNTSVEGSGGDHDSYGLFQQRPSMGWGTPQQLLDPEYASWAFYNALLEVEGWQDMPLTQAAQEVQVSAFPDAYAKHETDATEFSGLFAEISSCQMVSGEGWTHPVPGQTVGSAFRSLERPNHDGVDIMADFGTAIYAVADGVVAQQMCNAYDANGNAYSCDEIGSPAILGCGWYVDIDHTDGSTTRYCHMESEPVVNIGDEVTAGQPIGVVGSSGNSSGPHLHFETHTNHDAGSSSAVPPVAFMRQRGVELE